MSTRIVMIVEGSPRMNGNSAILAKQLVAGEIRGKPDLLKQAYELGRQLGFGA
ncbi:MAG: hypothetical protein WCO26_15000 [Deltaproteobacteria bacterium]